MRHEKYFSVLSRKSARRHQDSSSRQPGDRRRGGKHENIRADHIIVRRKRREKCQCHYPVPRVSVSLSCTPSVSVIILYPESSLSCTPSVSVIILYPECQCHYPVPRVSVSLSCTPSVSVIILYPSSVSVIILYPECQCHYPAPRVSVSLSCTPSVNVIILHPECQCHYPVPQVSVSLSCTQSVSVIILYPKYSDIWVVQDTGVVMDIKSLSSCVDLLTARVQNIQDFVAQNSMLEPRIPIPDLFSGDRAKFLSFKNNCKLFLALKPRSSGDPVQQVKIIISLLRGDPQDWAFSLAPGDPALCNIDAFFPGGLGLLYDEPNSVDQAEKNLLALCQGQDEIEIYCQKFRKWSALTQWNECALAAIFRKGLSEALKEVMVGFPMPAGLNESISLAIQIGRRLRERKSVHHLAVLSEHKPEPMQCDRTLTRAERQEHRCQNGLCFYCGDSTHAISDCPKGTKRFAKSATIGTKDGSLRPCIDYRLLNKITVKFQYPLPLLSDLFARIKGASWFTKIDLRGAYNLVRIKLGDEWKTAFNTPEGHFEYLVMPFGLANAPSVFQSFMHDIFREYLDKFLIVYLDDILVFSDDWESHVKQMDPVKVQAIYDWTQPTSLKSLQKFLGFANFYRRFICNFSSIAKPLTDLTKKGADVVNWSSAAVETFQELKRRFSSAPVLCQPDVSLPFQIEVDASEIGAGAVLSQRGADCPVMKPCAFFSRKFSPAEQNYDVGNRELLAMKWAFEEWRHWLEGAKHRVVVLTDHKNLTYLESAKRLNPRQARWSLFFSRFDFVVSYLPGSKNVKADALSRSFVPDSPGLPEPAGILKEG
ncbi:unnamed protein product, partial [Ranitomeya imitator]